MFGYLGWTKSSPADGYCLSAYTPVAVMVQVTFSVTEELAGRFGTVKPAPCKAGIVNTAGQVAPPVRLPAGQVTVVQFSPVAAGS